MGLWLGMGWNPYLWEDNKQSPHHLQKVFFIDLMMPKEKELVWEGEG
jgi:hypothetical protein